MPRNIRLSPRHVARVGHRDVWFPEGLSEVVAHTDGRFLSVTLTGIASGPGKVWIEEFDCGAREPCFAQLREWLCKRGAGGDDRAPEHIAAWAADVAGRIVDALYRQLA
jgi:hypothetical protein